MKKKEGSFVIGNKYVNYNDKEKYLFLLTSIINKHVNSNEKEIIALKSNTKVPPPHIHFLRMSLNIH